LGIKNQPPEAPRREKDAPVENNFAGPLAQGVLDLLDVLLF